jgi:hypothetical protein
MIIESSFTYKSLILDERFVTGWHSSKKTQLKTPRTVVLVVKSIPLPETFEDTIFSKKGIYIHS